MYDNPRSSYFKYMSPSTAKIVLKNRTLRWSTPRLLNDPYDLNIQMPLDFDISGIAESALDRMWLRVKQPIITPSTNPLGAMLLSIRQIVADWDEDRFKSHFRESVNQCLRGMKDDAYNIQDQLRTKMQTTKILCLTENPTENLMWSHYSASHTGVVFEFTTSRILDSAWLCAKPVAYADSPPQFISDEELISVASGDKNLDIKNYFDRFVYTKSNSFAYEKEWRVFAGDGRSMASSYEDLGFHSQELKTIIFGCRASREFEVEIRSLAASQYPHAAFGRAISKSYAFNLAIEPA